MDALSELLRVNCRQNVTKNQSEEAWLPEKIPSWSQERGKGGGIKVHSVGVSRPIFLLFREFHFGTCLVNFGDMFASF